MIGLGVPILSDASSRFKKILLFHASSGKGNLCCPKRNCGLNIMINPMKDLEASIPTLNWFAIRESKGADARA
jgi:hypothetical protein